MSATPGRAPLVAQRLMGGDITRIYKRGRRARGALFAVVVLENTLAKRRMGLSVGKRHAKGAVERNRARRILREAFRLSRAELPEGVDVILIPHPGGPPMELAAVQKELVALVARALKKAPREPS